MIDRRPKHSRLPIAVAVLVTLAGLAVVWQVQRATEKPPLREPNKYVLPAGFTGKIKIIYQVEGAPPLEVQDGYRVIDVPPSGQVSTSSEMLYGTAVDLFVRRLPEGGTEELTVMHLGLRKNGLVGDKNEFFESTEELARRDEDFARRGALDAEGRPILDKPYEMIIIRDEFR